MEVSEEHKRITREELIAYSLLSLLKSMDLTQINIEEDL
jgi:hypothetical protein